MAEAALTYGWALGISLIPVLLSPPSQEEEQKAACKLQEGHFNQRTGDETIGQGKLELDFRDKEILEGAPFVLSLQCFLQWGNEVTHLTILQGRPAASTGMCPDAALGSPGMHLTCWKLHPPLMGANGAVRHSVSSRCPCSTLLCRWPFGGCPDTGALLPQLPVHRLPTMCAPDVLASLPGALPRQGSQSLGWTWRSSWIAVGWGGRRGVSLAPMVGPLGRGRSMAAQWWRVCPCAVIFLFPWQDGWEERGSADLPQGAAELIPGSQSLHHPGVGDLWAW